MKSLIQLACLSVAVLLASGCGVLPKTSRQDIYQLPASTIAAHPEPFHTLSLRIVRPAASGVLRSPRILVMQSPNKLSAFPAARWNSPPAILLRDQLLDAFYNDGRIRNLSSDTDRLPARYELGGVLRTFHLNPATTPAQVEIRLDARLVDATSQSIVATQRFTSRAAVDEQRPSNVVAALGRAADQLARELIDWTITQMGSDTPP